ncbi:archaetidylserine decarboxylase [Alicyclobacillus dauci]|uniref:phosphatidylserine decarboxylase n=1 Tax=Alicyclobacillus dauci TaxID=1475485 RepID=A0ABY6YZT8_9BACL|nr:archaetidylserine decarboxylase [Alicyclobacillus dauci]WAH35486.1 archaetidylserine decarboxylase [Alicyclobacillus dauci]
MPKRTYTRLLGQLVGTRISKKFIPWYANHFHISEDELEKPMSEYETLGEFFSRKLGPAARFISTGIVSPVDGTVSTMGTLDGQQLLQIKGMTYSLVELLGDDLAAKAYAGGQYITLYLSPRDYHRIHAPVDCQARLYRHVPGTLFPVNKHGIRHISRLFVRNERLVTYFESNVGPFIMVKVGAAGVGTVVAPYAEARSSRDRGRGPVLSSPCDMSFRRGDEVGFFALGSTVVLLFPPVSQITWRVQTGDSVRMGQTIANVE